MSVGPVITILLSSACYGIGRAEDACSSPSGYLPSPTSCSSYLYCDWTGREQEAECGEGTIWNEESNECEEGVNINCRRGPLGFRILKEAPGIVKFGLQLISLAERVGTKLFGIGPGTDSYSPKANEIKDQTLQTRFGLEELEPQKDEEEPVLYSGPISIPQIVEPIALPVQQAKFQTDQNIPSDEEILSILEEEQKDNTIGLKGLKEDIISILEDKNQEDTIAQSVLMKEILSIVEDNIQGDRISPRLLTQDIVPILQEQAQEEKKVLRILKEEILPILQEQGVADNNVPQILRQVILPLIQTTQDNTAPRILQQEILPVLKGKAEKDENVLNILRREILPILADNYKKDSVVPRILRQQVLPRLEEALKGQYKDDSLVVRILTEEILPVLQEKHQDDDRVLRLLNQDIKPILQESIQVDRSAPWILQQEILPLLREKAQEENSVEKILKEEILPFLQDKVKEEENVLEILKQDVLSALKTKPNVPKITAQEIFGNVEVGKIPPTEKQQEYEQMMPENVKQDWGISSQSMQQPEVLINQETIPIIPATPNRIFSYNTISQGAPHQKDAALPWMFPGLVPASLLDNTLSRKGKKQGQEEGNTRVPASTTLLRRL